MRITLLLSLILITLASCQEELIPTPKPRCYPKIDLPKKAYQSFDADYCPFQFEYPSYAEIEQDTLFFEERPEHPCWFDVSLPSLNGKIHCSYYELADNNRFEELVSDAFELAQKHNAKADYIEEFPVQKNGVSGFVFNIEGATASQMQFFVTDSTQHFLRGSMYFNSESRPDSIAPIAEFVKTDIMRMIDSFRWE